MPATLRHFAINADDVPRAKRFYEQAFEWTFAPWGPPNFYQVKNAGPEVQGALQERREIIPGARSATFETSFGVDDLKATIAAIEAAGGEIVMQPYRIEGVGELIYFRDTEGNIAGAIQFEPGYAIGR
ncbi:hypothetical protein NPJ82_16895 (plasmid) [Sphingomonas sp. NY01]|uniref:VOC family protein n=1 Tax=Sphingomonas sp. NY01 TaxID=2968057 RepID=UPI00315DEB03